MLTFKRYLREYTETEALMAAKKAASGSKQPWVAYTGKNGESWIVKKSTYDSTSEKTRNTYTNVRIVNPSQHKRQQYNIKFKYTDDEVGNWRIGAFSPEDAIKLWKERVNDHGKYKFIKIEEVND